MRIRDILTDAAKGDPSCLMNEIDFLIKDKGYPVERIFLLGIKAGIHPDYIAVTLFQMYGSELPLFN